MAPHQRQATGLERLRAAPSTGKLVLVSAMTPTKYGEGKTTTSIGPSDNVLRVRDDLVKLFGLEPYRP